MNPLAEAIIAEAWDKVVHRALNRKRQRWQLLGGDYVCL